MRTRMETADSICIPTRSAVAVRRISVSYTHLDVYKRQAQYMATVDKALAITKVVRFEVGEGIEKKEEDFAAEVAAQQAAAAKK